MKRKTAAKRCYRTVRDQRCSLLSYRYGKAFTAFEVYVFVSFHCDGGNVVDLGHGVVSAADTTCADATASYGISEAV